MGAAYTFPTAEMLQQYVAAVKRTPGGVQTPLDSSGMGAPQVSGPISRGIRGLRNWLGITILGADGPDVLFGPQQPLQPIGQNPDQAVVGRPWDYPTGYNTRTTPRSGMSVGFPTLKALASYDVLSIMLSRVKDKVVSQKWAITPKDEKAKPDARCDEVREFLEFPDKEHSFDDWCRMLLDQALIYDAPAVYLRNTRGGDLYSAEVIDGSLITPKITADGRTPSFDIGPAYQQVIKGIGAVDYIKPVPKGIAVPVDGAGNPFPELLYKPRNPRIDSVYGFSPVEQIITTINIALRREEFFLGYYKDGSTPDLLISCPKEWNPDQIAKFKVWWDAVLRGNLEARRGTMFIPDGAHQIDTKEKTTFVDGADEWLTRIMCFSLGLNPMPFLKQMNKGQEKTHHDEASQEGLEPWLEWLTGFINNIIRIKFGYADIGFRWQEDEATDELTRATIDKMLVDAKIFHPDELRAKRGEEPMAPDLREQMDMATFASTVNATVLPPDQQAEADQRSADQAEQQAKLKPEQPPVAGKSAVDEVMAKLADVQAALGRFTQPNITVEAPQIHVTPAPITVNTPAVKVDAPITVEAAKQADVFVDVGATNVTAKFDMVKRGEAGERVATYTRDDSGHLVAKITEKYDVRKE